MITTNVPWLEAELLEESKFFSSVTDKTIITHSSREENGFFLNEITVNGKAYVTNITANSNISVI